MGTSANGDLYQTEAKALRALDADKHGLNEFVFKGNASPLLSANTLGAAGRLLPLLFRANALLLGNALRGVVVQEAASAITRSMAGGLNGAVLPTGA